MCYADGSGANLNAEESDGVPFLLDDEGTEPNELSQDEEAEIEEIDKSDGVPLESLESDTTESSIPTTRLKHKARPSN